MIDIEQLANDCLEIAQAGTPKFTGNMAFNSLQLQYIENGFQLVWIRDIAPYVETQQTSGINAGFIDNIAIQVNARATAYTNGNINNMDKLKNDMQKQSVDNPLRQETFLKSLAQTVEEV